MQHFVLLFYPTLTFLLELLIHFNQISQAIRPDLRRRHLPQHQQLDCGTRPVLSVGRRAAKDLWLVYHTISSTTLVKDLPNGDVRSDCR